MVHHPVFQKQYTQQKIAELHKEAEIARFRKEAQQKQFRNLLNAIGRLFTNKPMTKRPIQPQPTQS